MITDCFFAQGSVHTVCQDNAGTRQNERFAFAVISDGCSSSPTSEIGSALLPHLFIQSYLDVDRWMEHHPTYDGQSVFNSLLLSYMQRKVSDVMDSAGLGSHTFDATIVAAIADKQQGVLELYMFGDGHFVLKRKDATVIRSIHYPKYNAPYYFSYTLDKERKDSYITAFGDSGPTLTSGGGRVNDSERMMPDYMHYERFPFDKGDVAAVFSDGLETYTHLNDEEVLVPVPFDDVVKDATEYKVINGEFVKRRMTRLNKAMNSKGISHYDDVSCAAIAYLK